MAEGWRLDRQALSVLNQAAVEDPRMHLYLAHVDGEPAAVASAMLSRHSVFLQGAMVMPRFRGQGLYRALVERRMADARAQGRGLAFTHAMAATSSPLLRRMGFAELFRFESFSARLEEPPPH
jgi:GNAT superfamily N-acetyltransferase